MKLIVLGGGAIQIKTIKITKGITPAAFITSMEGGSDILIKLKERSSRVHWADALSRIEWSNHRGEVISWFLSNEAA